MSCEILIMLQIILLPHVKQWNGITLVLKNEERIVGWVETHSVGPVFFLLLFFPLNSSSIDGGNQRLILMVVLIQTQFVQLLLAV